MPEADAIDRVLTTGNSMLKFLRKYQLILLAVGGSLLMVVFLLQPVLQQLTPDPRKRTVAMIGDEKITMGDQIQANQELELLERFYPDLLPMLGLVDEKTNAAHWILLKHEAEQLGAMGVQRDGADWIQELAIAETQARIRQFQQSGRFLSPEEREEIAEIVLNRLLQTRQAFVDRFPGQSAAGFDSVLSRARGVMRMRNLYVSGPQLTRARAADSMVEDGTMVLTDLVVIGPDAVMGEIAEPTEAEIAAFFAEYRGTVPGNTDEAEGGNPFGFGYTLPPRVKLEWLTLDRSAIAAVVQADPVVVRRRWQRENPDGGDFDADRVSIEQTVRDETIDRILTDADEIVRGEILNRTRELKKEGIYRVVPSDWAAPDLETIAGDVVEAIQERHGVRIPRPRVQRRTDAWQTPADLQSLPGVGFSGFQIGNQRAFVFQLPEMVRGIGEDTRVAVQPRVPIIDPPATGADGSRYYITVLEARGESPPDDLDEIRDRIVENIKDKRAFDMLTDRLASFREAAESGGLDAAAALGANNGVPPTIATDIMVSKDRVLPTGASRPSPAANRPAFREAVVEAGSMLDPLAEADSADGPETVVLTPIPAAQSLVVAKVRAKRPPSLDDFRRMQGLVVGQRVRELVAEAQDGADPLGFVALSDRLGYEEVGGGGDDDEDAAG
jgi:hypothetical protein